MSLYGRLFARVYDHMLAGTERAGLSDRRHELLSSAGGRVLEIGAGTGLNLSHYPDSVEELVLAEPEAPMARRLERRLAESGRAGRVVLAPAESLPLEDDSRRHGGGDAGALHRQRPPALRWPRSIACCGREVACCSWSTCAAEDPAVARWQDRLHGIWFRIGHGCHCNRPTPDLIEASPLEVERLERDQLPKAPPITRPLATGSATAR